MRRILRDAFRSDELQYQLCEVIAVDDKCPVESLPDAVIIEEAAFVLSKYTDAAQGFFHHAELQGDEGPELKRAARANVKALRAFLAKYRDRPKAAAVPISEELAPF